MSTAYQNLTPAQLREEYAAVKAQFDALKAKELKLNMARGKPGKEQLDLVSDILSILKTPEDCMSNGVEQSTVQQCFKAGKVAVQESVASYSWQIPNANHGFVRNFHVMY